MLCAYIIISLYSCLDDGGYIFYYELACEATPSELQEFLTLICFPFSASACSLFYVYQQRAGLQQKLSVFSLTDNEITLKECRNHHTTGKFPLYFNQIKIVWPTHLIINPLWRCCDSCRCRNELWNWWSIDTEVRGRSSVVTCEILALGQALCSVYFVCCWCETYAQAHRCIWTEPVVWGCARDNERRILMAAHTVTIILGTITSPSAAAAHRHVDCDSPSLCVCERSLDFLFLLLDVNKLCAQSSKHPTQRRGKFIKLALCRVHAALHHPTRHGELQTTLPLA